ncbi:MAG TPA: MFS transporter, partial [archaeon]|nr:MFS transporter [archaeon]
MVAIAREEKGTAAVVAGVIGNVLEWFDFGVYGFFASVIGRQFFPSSDPIASLLATFAVFAVGFFFRPLGALVFGHYGDRAGRRNALAATVMLMAISTFAIGVMPTYTGIGVW